MRLLIPQSQIQQVLDGSKTMHRIPLKEQPVYRENKTLKGHYGSFLKSGMNLDHPVGMKMFLEGLQHKIGDVVWVPEVWGVGTRPCPHQGWYDGIEYKADELLLTDERDLLPLYDCKLPENVDFSDYQGKGWKSALTMPKWASRIHLRITDVRVERLGDMVGFDLSKEGIHGYDIHESQSQEDIWNEFKTHWNQTNKIKFESNPWVEVLTFEVIKKEGV